MCGECDYGDRFGGGLDWWYGEWGFFYGLCWSVYWWMGNVIFGGGIVIFGFWWLRVFWGDVFLILFFWFMVGMYLLKYCFV